MGSLVGSTLGHFRVEREIGSGGMGAVYAAVDEKLEREVALKVLLDGMDSELNRKRLMREARLAAKLTHPNIATVYEVGEVGEQLYIVMELLEGQSLRKLLAARRLTTEEALGLARDIARALARAHAADIAHRDIKPENVFVTRPAPDVLLAKVLDFGLARQQTQPPVVAPRNEEHTSTETTAPGHVAGTPGYWSPEQARAGTIDRRTDIFSFGLVLYEMLAGRRAFKSNSTVGLVLAVTRHEPEPLRNLAPALDPAIEAIVARCLEKDPARRFQDGAELSAALESLLRRGSRHSIADGLPTDGDTLADAAGPPVARPESSSHLTVASAPPNVTSFEEVPSALVAPRERFRFALAVGGGVAAAALVLVLVVAGGQALFSGRAASSASKEAMSSASSESAPAPASEPDAPPAPEPEAPPALEPLASSAAPVEPSSPAPVGTPTPLSTAASLAGPTSSARPRPATTNKKADCAQPFTVDAKGVKIPKLHCL
ncbi:MAG: serine/threonine protein kinase [Labilithrix sp.]|nr:serine/threonine protein kinase [Labilithrix sp.]